MTLEDLLRFLGEAVVAALISTGLLTWFAQKWIENRFERSLKEYEYKINALFSRVSKIHEKEFEVLPTAWEKMHDALGNVTYLTRALQSYPDIDRMSGDQLQEFLEECDLKSSDKKALLEAKDKNSFYQERIYWYRLRDTKQSIAEYRNYLVRNSIFLSPDLRAQFEKMDNLLRDVTNLSQVGTEAKFFPMTHSAYEKIQGESETIIQEITNLVQARLRFDRAAD